MEWKDNLLISIEDNGIGIHKDISNDFEKFYRYRQAISTMWKDLDWDGYVKKITSPNTAELFS